MLGLVRPTSQGLGRIPLLLGLAAAVAAVVLPASEAWALPVASFTHAPDSPLTRQSVTFASTATTDPGGTIVSEAWDFNDDGKYDDASGPTATFAFVRPGQQRVALQVVDSFGNEDSHHERILVGNRPPVVSIVPVPTDPSPGKPVTFFSTSTDPDGFIAALAWDLDGDGQFDDATGSSATVMFPPSGQYRVGLQATDDSGASSTLVLAINRGAAGISFLRLMSPFPVVRVSGIVRKRGIRLRVLSVSAPVGATVSVRCGGRGCPFRRRSRTVAARARSTGLGPDTGLVRIRRFGRRLLRVGATVQIYVTGADTIGKYTRLKVRRGRLPARVDRCVLPGSRRPVPCPPG